MFYMSEPELMQVLYPCILLNLKIMKKSGKNDMVSADSDKSFHSNGDVDCDPSDSEGDGSRDPSDSEGDDCFCGRGVGD